MDDQNKVVILGAGLAGLTAAIELEQVGIKPTILEASHSIGGRVKTDKVEGFLLDHGFQVLLTAYPEAKRYLDYEKLDLGYFAPGAKVFEGNRNYTVTDPIREISSAFTMLFSPVGTLSDKWKMWQLKNRVLRTSPEEVFEQSSLTTLDYLRNTGFSEQVINRFFRPFFSGIFLEENLETSGRMFQFVFKMFSEGFAAIPAQGMGAIPQQLEGKLNGTDLQLNKKVISIEDRLIKLENGEEVRADCIIIATDANSLIPQLSGQHSSYHQTINCYFSIPKRVGKPLISLVAQPGSVVNNFCIPSHICPEYAPLGRDLLSVTILNDRQMTETDLTEHVRGELTRYTGLPEESLVHLNNYYIPKALPVLSEPQYEIPPTETKLYEGVFLAGDHMLNGSLNAAMISGRTAASAAITALNQR